MTRSPRPASAAAPFLGPARAPRAASYTPQTLRRAFARRAGAAGWHRLAGAVLPALLFALWWHASHRQWMSPQILPTPELVWQTAVELAGDNLFSQLAVSLARLATGFAAGVAAGVALGALTGRSRTADDIVSPVFYAFAQIPTLAWLPLLMVVLGIGEALKIALIVKAVLVPVAIHTQLGVRGVPPRLREIAAVARLPRTATLRLLVAPAALPPVMTGLRIALAQGWLTLIAVELLASSEGIGYLMVWGRQMFQLDIVFVCIAVIGATGFAMDDALRRLDAGLVRWPRAALAEHASAPRRSALAWLHGALLPAALAALWAAAAHWHWVDARVLPAPSAVLASAFRDIASGALPVPLARTLLRALEGLALGATAGAVAGVAFGLVRGLGRAAGPTFAALRQVAIFAWIPLLTAWAGIDELSKVIFVALAAFFPMLVAAQRSVESLSPQLAEAARTLRLPARQRLGQLVLPAIAPGLFAGLRLGLVYAWLGAIGAEYFMPSGVGIGGFMLDAQQLFRMDRLMSAAVIVGALGAALGWLGGRLEAAATRWRGPR
ncbi:ABC transporter permease [Burkholderia sp. ABCPW 111]|uniref:ABC transporter permease n=1 Tax=Burkholderia sp. ABCPW 111 TaxID=1820025 RepID=UPI000531F90A|nr:ABC transporter permease subunit [Burkholderia sp. ABCPW 111]KGR93316.1 binding--dependent transport system inner membrane component family protein [Burkholderia sp. ABCPW 111]